MLRGKTHLPLNQEEVNNSLEIEIAKLCRLRKFKTLLNNTIFQANPIKSFPAVQKKADEKPFKHSL